MSKPLKEPTAVAPMAVAQVSFYCMEKTGAGSSGRHVLSCPLMATTIFAYRIARTNVTAWSSTATIMVKPSTVPTIFCRGPEKACLAERLDGDLYFNARAYFDDGKRYTAISHDGGSHFTESLPDGQLREVRQGCSASLVRYPPELCGGRDILLFANPDSTGKYREHGVVHVSFDGGKSWPINKAVTQWGEWFDYSAMAISHDGKVLLMYKTTPNMTGMPTSSDECCSMALARFDLEWLIQT